MLTKSAPRLFLRFCCGAFVVLGLSRCAYHAGDARTLDQNYRIFVPVLENRTSRAIDVVGLTSMFRQQLEKAKGITVVNDRADCDFMILGQVMGYDRTWGTEFYQGDPTSEIVGGLKNNFLSAQSTNIALTIQIEKRNPAGELVWKRQYVEQDQYQMSDRLELAQGSAATPQIHASREALLVNKLADTIFRRTQSRIIDDF